MIFKFEVLRGFFANGAVQSPGEWFVTSDYYLACLLVEAGKARPLDSATEVRTAKPQAVWGTVEIRQAPPSSWATGWRH